MRIDSKTQILLKKTFNNVIDRNFKEFLINSSTQNQSSIISIDDFFSMYEEIFYSIQKEGETNSHRYLLKKSAEYLGEISNTLNVQELLDEINSLNQQLLDSNKELANVINTTK
jgi:glutaredoxin 2